MALEHQLHEDQDIKIQLDKDEGKRDDPPVAGPSPAAPAAGPSDNAAAGGNGIVEFLKTANHPGICVLQFIFKFGAIFSYRPC